MLYTHHTLLLPLLQLLRTRPGLIYAQKHQVWACVCVHSRPMPCHLILLQRFISGLYATYAYNMLYMRSSGGSSEFRNKIQARTNLSIHRVENETRIRWAGLKCLLLTSRHFPYAFLSARVLNMFGTWYVQCATWTLRWDVVIIMLVYVKRNIMRCYRPFKCNAGA